MYKCLQVFSVLHSVKHIQSPPGEATNPGLKNPLDEGKGGHLLGLYNYRSCYLWTSVRKLGTHRDKPRHELFSIRRSELQL